MDYFYYNLNIISFDNIRRRQYRKSMEYNSKFMNEETELLFDAVLSLETKDDCYRFFEDICTINEFQSIAQRFYIAKMLFEDKTYQEIEEITKASTATISRINKCLKYGADGYKITLDRITDESSED